MKNLSSEEIISNVLIVDDKFANLRLLASLLQREGFKVRPASSGALALRAVEASPPDLILLDVRMPDIDGYEVCRRLKANPKFADIPVIFITALDDTRSKLKAFELGAVDYITKPVQEEVVLQRVRTHLTLWHQRKTLQSQNQRLKELEDTRETLSNMIVHDLKNPMQVILGFAELIHESADFLSPERLKRSCKAIINSSRSALDLIQGLLDIAHFEAEQIQLNPSDLSLDQIIETTRDDLSFLLEERSLELRIESAPSFPQLRVDQELFRRVMNNLVSNAIKHSPANEVILIKAEHDTAGIRLSVSDKGPGIPLGQNENIFNKFASLDKASGEHRYATGLGLPFCRMVIEAHGGHIQAQNQGGALFLIQLPPEAIGAPPFRMSF